MVKKYQTVVTICLIMLMALSCLRIDNTSNYSTTSFTHTISIDEVASSILDVNTGCSRIEQEDYLNTSTSTYLLTSLYRRSLNNYRSYERQEVNVAVLDFVSKIVSFLIAMTLCATGSAGLSTPFRCLLYYIQDMDGKKKVA